MRGRFLSIYSIIQINIFEEPVFSDTSCTVCSLLFILGNADNNINIDIYPSKINIKTKTGGFVPNDVTLQSVRAD